MSFFNRKVPEAFLFLICLTTIACSPSNEDPQIGFQSGAVSSAQPIASEVGAAVLQKGGNAFDAAIATQFALAACLPNAGNLGGGGFILLRESSGKTRFLDFRETAPERAYRDMYLDSNSHVIVGASTLGPRSSGVPGTVDGLWKIHEEYGSLPWSDLVQPAIQIAKGYTLLTRESYLANKYAKNLEKQNGRPFFLLKDKGKWSPGDSVFNTDLASTLRLIADSGRTTFYRGSIRNQIIRETSLKGGFFTKNDFLEYESRWRDPLEFTYKEYNIVTAPLPSSGGIGLLGILSILEDRTVSDWGPHSPRTVHEVVEAEKIFYHQRALDLGDPDYYPVPEHLLSKDFYRNAGKEISDMARPSSAFKRPKMELRESVETTHVSIADKDGNLVAMTITLNGAYGSKFCVPGLGFFMNNEMDDFSIKPGVPNQYGLTGGEANAIEPGKRMLSSMTPTIIEKNGKPYMVLGSPGGSTIITTVLQVILNVLEFGMPIKEAVDAKRYHHQWLPDSIWMEPGLLSGDDSMELVRKGHAFKKEEILGRVNALLLKEGKIYAGPDRRWDNAAAGY